MASTIFESALKNTPKDVKIFAEKSLDILDQIQFELVEQGLTQKDISKKLGKSESEISKWFSGLHNMTLKSISKLEAVLNRDILITPLKAKQKYSSVHYVTTRSAIFHGSVKRVEDNYYAGEHEYLKAS